MTFFHGRLTAWADAIYDQIQLQSNKRERTRKKIKLLLRRRLPFNLVVIDDRRRGRKDGNQLVRTWKLDLETTKADGNYSKHLGWQGRFEALAQWKTTRRERGTSWREKIKLKFKSSSWLKSSCGGCRARGQWPALTTLHLTLSSRIILCSTSC